MERSPHTQEDVEWEVLEVLRLGRIMTTREVQIAVKRRLNLTAADLRRANKRDESKIDQIISNALNAERRLCRNGLIERTGKGEFRITEQGQKYLSDQEAKVAEVSGLLDEIFPNLNENSV